MSVAREKLVVMKFGGTSVEDAQAMKRTAAIVAGRRERGLKAVTVVSAMAKVTDLLIASGAAAGRGDKAGRAGDQGAAADIGITIRRRSCWSRSGLCGSRRRCTGVRCAGRSAARDCCGGELTPRTNDLVVSFGERLSSRMMAEALDQHGLGARMWMRGASSSRMRAMARRCRRRRD